MPGIRCMCIFQDINSVIKFCVKQAVSSLTSNASFQPGSVHNVPIAYQVFALDPSLLTMRGHT